MDFSDSSNKQGLVEDIDFLVSTNSTSYPTADKTRSINSWYHKVVAWILESSPEWEWDDSNYTDFPIATATLVAGQEDYTLPAATSSDNASTFLKLIGVSILDSGGNKVKLRHIDELDLPTRDISEVFKTDGVPSFYQTMSNAIKLRPAPASSNVTLSNGLIVYFQRTFDEFTASDTTQEPGFAAPFHRILSYGGAYDYEIAKFGVTEKAKGFRAEISDLEKQLKEFYGQRNRDIKIKFIPREIRNIPSRI